MNMLKKMLMLILGCASFHAYTMEVETINLGTPAIQRALEITLPPASSAPSDEGVQGILDEATSKIKECNYDKALSVVLAGFDRFPADFQIQLDIAAILGDHAENFSGCLKEIMTKKSLEMFDKLKKEVKGQPKHIEFYLRNEYCYRTADYKAQYELGVEEVSYYWGSSDYKTKGYKGYYCQGVGAAHYAEKLLKNGDREQAREYAQKAVIAWAQYFSYNNTYYNAYVHYALALGILGHKDKMIEALTRSADLINKDFSYFEFQEVLQFVEAHSEHIK